MRELFESRRTSDQLAVTTALTSAKDLSEQHNGLLRRMEKLVETFSTKSEVTNVSGSFETRFQKLESWQARLTGGMFLLAFIGIANLVKVWT